MKILMVSSYLPYPLFSGGHIRLYNLIKHLSKRHKITLVCEKREYQKERDIKEVGKFCEKVVTFNREKQWSFENIIKTGFSALPFLVVGHTISAMKRKLQELLRKEHFDLIHVETSYVYQNIPETQLPIILVEHNIEYLVYKRFAENAPLPLKPFLYIDILKLRYWEEKTWKKATRLVAVSEIEKKIMDKKRKAVKVVPNGVDTEKYKVSSIKYKVSRKEKIILFIGDFRWVQNKDAAIWILKEIWPKINLKFRIKNLKLWLWIVGREIPENIKSLGGENVLFDENAPIDTSLIYKKADVLLAPIRVGGGTSFKILEAMASGVLVITTSLGNEGIDARDREEILIAGGSYDFGQKVIDILENEEEYERIVNKARKFIEKKYDWRIVVSKLEGVYESVMVFKNKL
ncbi:MAG: glycosyltransferase family 4 protein [Patescibacteria group bacterium]